MDGTQLDGSSVYSDVLQDKAQAFEISFCLQYSIFTHSCLVAENG